jgi:hypothetical protein
MREYSPRKEKEFEGHDPGPSLGAACDISYRLVAIGRVLIFN